MVKDISPGLLAKIKGDFQSQFDKSNVIKKLYQKVRDGTATYTEANELALAVGNMLAKAFQRNLSSEVLPDGKMYYNIAKSVVEPMMVNNYDLISSVTEQVQTSMNKNAKVGMKAIVPPVKQDRIDGIVNRLSSSDDFDEVKWILAEPVINYSQSIITDSIEANASFQYDAGLAPKIIRKSRGKCCDWCMEVVGEYEYPDVPRDVWRRHDYCRCSVEYVVGKARKNVHNNNTGKRRYVPDGYGGYEKSREARIAHAEQMKATEKERAERAREKRIATWARKRGESQ